MSKKQSKAPRSRADLKTPVRPRADLKALVRRLADVEATTFAHRRTEAPIVPLGGQQLTDAPALGTLGLTELKLTAKEEAVLARPADPVTVMIKPTGQPYISHPTYTRWLNEAFGRTGWALVQTSMPSGRSEGNKAQVVAHYTLFVHSKPVAQAWGEQEYWANNAEQSYGDALEATIASALRRCCKHLGIGLEMWDRPWLNRFIAEHCVQVPCLVWDGRERSKVRKLLWRRKDDPALKGEYDGRQEGEHFEAERPTQRDEAPNYEYSEKPTAAPARASRPAAVSHERTGDVISPAQNKRLFAILRNIGRNEEAFRAWLERRFGYTSTADITRRNYDFICRAIESPRALPEQE